MAGDFVVMRSGEGLPEEISCAFFSQGGDLLQSIIINTSGQEDLYLKDKFGSLSLEACNSQQCLADVTYTYKVENSGSTSMTVSKFDRFRNGDQANLLPDRIPFELGPGDFATASEIQIVDLCIGEFKKWRLWQPTRCAPFSSAKLLTLFSL